MNIAGGAPELRRPARARRPFHVDAKGTGGAAAALARRAAPVRRARGRRVADNLRSVAQHGDAFVEKMTIQEEGRNMAVHPQERARRSALRKTLTAQGY